MNITTINDLKELLLSKDKVENSIIDCNIDVLLIYLRGIQYDKNTIINVRIDQPDKRKHKQAFIRFRDGLVRIFQIKDNLLISKDNNLCIFQKEFTEEIKNLLNENRYEHFKNCIKELENINKDYAETVKVIISYDS